ncbi:MAG: glycosyltransferase family 4 protein [Deltaproteobacteria bacterium]|jgi:glycosyltransferase involved in cell wall biosynthesis|nr:glycosyltransferase family 4 protein [Deltaproteobacteria bacterium]
MTVKVLIIYPTDPLGPKVGGAETFLKGFIKNAPEDFDVAFIGISSDRQKRPPKKWIKLKLGNREFNFLALFFEKDENKKTTIPLSLRFTLALRLSPINISNKLLVFNRIEPTILYRSAKCPKVAIIHSDVQKQTERGGSEVLWSKFPRLYFIFEKLIITSMDHVYTVSNNSLEFYRSKYPERKKMFSFLPTWADTDIFYPKDEPKFSIRSNLLSLNNDLPIDEKWILFVGRLQKVKAPIRLIDTFMEYYRKDTTACLIIIGEGNLREAMVLHVKKMKMENKVFFLGNVSQETLALFYRGSDVLLLTSNFEGMPMCVLEALGCGLPVISTNVGEVKRVVKNEFSGEVVESVSPKIISQSIEKVLSNPDIYSKDNCIKAISEYTPQKVLKPVYGTVRKLYRERCTVK